MLSPTTHCKIHSNNFHLFHNPFCAKQTLLQKIGNIFFHIFTFGIPMAFYRVITCCFPKASFKREEDTLKNQAIKNMKRNDQGSKFLEKIY